MTLLPASVRLAALAALLPAAAGAQGALAAPEPAAAGGGSSLRALVAAPADGPVAVDGRLDDPAWQGAAVAGDFVQRRPAAGRPASQRSEARVLYADDAVYVGMRLYDTGADSVAATLGRRDFGGFSDWAHVLIDSYHDRRTAFRFSVNPAGVKSDAFVSGDDEEEEDVGWDAVWDAAAARDSLGWTVEMRIPLSQLRFAAGEGTWGIQFARDVARRRERSLWAPAAPEQNGYVSRFGELRGLRVRPRRRLETVPYVVGRVEREPGDAADPFHRARGGSGSLGADLRYGLTSDLTLTATLNPDFGQVEADPSEVNLTAFETFLAERRPFFVEGQDIFQLELAEAPWIHGTEALFYSRRIGRAPRGSAPADALYADQPEMTTLLGAAKLSGRTAGGWSVGLLGAVTGEEEAEYVTPAGARESTTVEPLTAYTMARVSRDFRAGLGALGGVYTATRRALDDGSRPLPAAAYVGGVDGRVRVGGGNWDVAGALLGSHLGGSAEAIDAVVRGPVHRFQRPDAAHLDHRPGRTSLSGLSAMGSVTKNGGGNWRGAVAAHLVTPGFDANDMGYHTGSDFARGHLLLGYQRMQPGRFRRWWGWWNSWSAWTFGGERMLTGTQLNANLELHSLWEASAVLRRDQSALSPTALRGGPALLTPGRTRLGWTVSSDRRQPLRVTGSTTLTWGDQGDRVARIAPAAVYRPSARAELTLQPALQWNRDRAQWLRNLGDGAEPVHLVGDLRQTTASVTTRLDYTFTPDLSFQLYAQPFVSSGRYEALREVREPRARAFGERFRTYAPDQAWREGERYRVDRDGDGEADLSLADPAFGVRELNSTAVLRWEFRPGSSLFVVWSHRRSGDGEYADADLWDDARELWALPSRDVLLVKWSHWLGW
ncbi:MAG TPA: DUF5916 domain-containing protein [Longimicrobiaceae bacterium]|nr:DUF5916 domain-containing protein [Longimicrobiaceae bacterium]